MILAAVGGRATLSTYHAQHQDEEDGSASEKNNAPDWHLVGRFFGRWLTSGAEAGVGFHASSDDMSEYVIHRRNMRWRMSRSRSEVYRDLMKVVNMKNRKKNEERGRSRGRRGGR